MAQGEAFSLRSIPIIAAVFAKNLGNFPSTGGVAREIFEQSDLRYLHGNTPAAISAKKYESAVRWAVFL